MFSHPTISVISELFPDPVTPIAPIRALFNAITGDDVSDSTERFKSVMLNIPKFRSLPADAHQRWNVLGRASDVQILLRIRGELDKAQ